MTPASHQSANTPDKSSTGTTLTTDASFQQLFEHISCQGDQQRNGQTLILTPNKRLSRFINDQYNRYQTSKASEGTLTGNAWPSLNCVSYQGWLQQQWQQVVMAATHPLSDRIPLTPLQESLVWEQVINDHPDTPALLAMQATIRLVQNAWRLRHEWHLDLNPYQDHNTRLFMSWCEAFESVCHEQALISPVEQPHVITEAIEQGDIQTPEHLYLYGFDDHSPQLLALLQAMASRAPQQTEGTRLYRVELAEQHTTPVRHEFSDSRHELEAAACWAKSLLEQASRQGLPTPPTIGIVVPNLAQEKETIERIFNRVFEPQMLLPDVPQHAPGFNLSAGQPLGQAPVIRTALIALQLHRELLDLEQVSVLLRSPFIGITRELDERVTLDIALRGHEFEVTLKQIKAAARTGKEKDTMTCPDLVERLQQYEARLKSIGRSNRYPSEWAGLFMELLACLGWPGNRKPDTLEFQQIQAWQDALQDFAALDAISGKISLSTATSHLNKVINGASFKAQTKDSPIQILGVLEAAGLPFDALWLMNMDDEVWPPAPDPNPLIPMTLQVERGLPQSTATRELEYARRLTQRFSQSASQLIVSHAKQRDDQELSPSPLTRQVALHPFNLHAPTGYAEQLFAQRTTESSWDTYGPHVHDVNRIRGGTQLLKDQAACPFRAFAKHRLNAGEIPDTTIGLDASERGNLIHNALEIIWRRLKNQERLLQLEDDALDELIRNAVEQVLADIKEKRFVGERFLQIESERLHRQLLQWMALEKQRAPFTVVMSEGKRTIKLGKLPINIRYDRIDKLEDGTLFVLDYKTGKPNVNQWADERPDEPQVPLYSIANQDKVSGAAFGQINADGIDLIGVAADTSIAPAGKLKDCDKITVLDTTDNWDTLVSQWRQVLEKLAKEFLAGKADVSPKKPPNTCRYCELHAFCRINEANNTGNDEEATDE